MRRRSVFKSLGVSLPTPVAALGLCALTFGTLGIGSVSAEDELFAQIEGKVRDVFEQRREAVVRIEARDSHGKLSGTGFVIDPSGTIYTLAAIVDGASEIVVCQGDKRSPAQVLTIDPRSGIALLKANMNSPFLPIGDSHSLEMATPVMSIGYPMDLPATPHFGLVAGFDRKFLGTFFCSTHVRANVPVQRGEGGAPILNMKGEVVGVLVSGIDGGAGCYFLPIAAAEKVRNDYVRFGEVRHGWVGVRVKEANETVSGSNAEIAELSHDAPASTSGLRNGDIVLRVGDVAVKNPEDILDASFFLSAGDAARIIVMRDGKQVTLNVKSAIHPLARVPGMTASSANDVRLEQSLQTP